MSVIKRKLKKTWKTRKAISLTALAVLVSGGGAIAYFTVTGAGTGSATVGTSTSLTLHGTAASTLYPGVSSVVDFTVDNGSSGHQRLGTVHLAGVHACVGAGSSWNGSTCTSSGVEATGCESFDSSASSATDDFSMSDVVSNTDFAPGNGQTVSQTGTLLMNDLSSSQDACKNANLTLSFTA